MTAYRIVNAAGATVDTARTYSEALSVQTWHQNRTLEPHRVRPSVRPARVSHVTDTVHTEQAHRLKEAQT